jgi:hypothetical protein
VSDQSLYAQEKIREVRTYTISNRALLEKKLDNYVLRSRAFYNSQSESVLSISYQSNGEIEVIRVYEYDSINNLLSYVIFDNYGRLTKNVEKTYARDGHILPIVFNIDTDWECKNTDRNYHTNCVYNKNGHLIYFEKKDKNGHLIETYKYEYDYY